MARRLTHKEAYRAVNISSEMAEISRAMTDLRSYRGCECEFDCKKCEKLVEKDHQRI